MAAKRFRRAAKMDAGDDEQRSAALEARLVRIEAALEALQDQVYRESARHDEELADLRRRLRPEEIARSLSDDTRRRGL